MSNVINILGLPSRRFEPRQYGLGAWTEHIYFAYDLVAELKPRLLVELGTDRGESYFAFCQSALENKTGTRCFAVDHWRGDAHAGSYDETTFQEIVRHNRAHYESFSTLLRSSFVDALERFEAESIDLLHIDGYHTEAAVRHDVNSWLPKLRPGGILLLHDVTMRGRDFGVWEVWAELVARGRSCTFEERPGLGVWEKPPAWRQPPLLEALFHAPNESRSDLIDYYRQRSDELQKIMAQQWRDGTVRSAPMASQTLIRVLWTSREDDLKENSVYARIGHGSWKEVRLEIPNAGSVDQLRIDFVSALTTIEIAAIALESQSGAPLLRAATAGEFERISPQGDCVRTGCDPLTIKVTGVNPQLHLPAFSSRGVVAPSVVRMRLRVNATYT